MSWEWGPDWGPMTHTTCYVIIHILAIYDCRFNFLDYTEYTGDSDNDLDDDNDINDSQPSEEPPSNDLPLPLLDSSSHETSPLHSPSPSSSSKKRLNVPQVEIIASHTGKGKGRSPLLQSHRTNSESHLATAHPQEELHLLDTATGQRLSRAMSSSHSGNLSLTNNGLLAKELRDHQQRGHSRSRSSGSSSGDSDSGIGKGGGGPLSSSSLPPDSLRRLVQSMQGMGHERKGSGGQLTASYHGQHS